MWIIKVLGQLFVTFRNTFITDDHLATVMCDLFFDVHLIFLSKYARGTKFFDHLVWLVNVVVYLGNDAC